MNYYNLYKLGRYGYFHITSYKFNSLSDAIGFYKKEFNVISLNTNKIGSCKVSGI